MITPVIPQLRSKEAISKKKKTKYIFLNHLDNLN